MTDADTVLAQLWAVDEAPARDASFRLAVVDRVAKRRFGRDLLTYATVAAGLGVAAWGVAPLFADLGASLSGGLALAGLAAVGIGLSLAPSLPAAFARS